MRLVKLTVVALMAAIVFAIPALAEEKMEEHPIATLSQSMGHVIKDIDALALIMKEMLDVISGMPGAPERDRLDDLSAKLTERMKAHEAQWKKIEKDRTEWREKGTFIRDKGSERH